MPLNIRSSRAKLDRAKEHLRVIDNEVSAWFKSGPYKPVSHVNEDSTRYSIFAKQTSPAPPLERWSLILGDCLHNLRSSLDHLIYAIAIHESGTTPPPDDTRLQFPICDTENEFRAGRNGESRIRSLSKNVRDAVEWMQPYNRRHTAIRPPLSILRDLVNADKHKLVRLAFATMMEGKFSLIGNATEPLTPTPFGHIGEVEDGTEIAAVIFDRPNPGLEFKNIEFFLVVALWHGKRDEDAPNWTGRSDYAMLLGLIIDEVEHVIKTVYGRAK